MRGSTRLRCGGETNGCIITKIKKRNYEKKRNKRDAREGKIPNRIVLGSRTFLLPCQAS